MASRLLTIPEVAERLGVHEQTLYRWRAEGVGPKWVRVAPRCIRYLPDPEIFREEEDAA